MRPAVWCSTSVMPRRRRSDGSGRGSRQRGRAALTRSGMGRSCASCPSPSSCVHRRTRSSSTSRRERRGSPTPAPRHRSRVRCTRSSCVDCSPARPIETPCSRERGPDSVPSFRVEGSTDRRSPRSRRPRSWRWMRSSHGPAEPGAVMSWTASGLPGMPSPGRPTTARPSSRPCATGTTRTRPQPSPAAWPAPTGASWASRASGRMACAIETSRKSWWTGSSRPTTLYGAGSRSHGGRPA